MFFAPFLFIYALLFFALLVLVFVLLGLGLIRHAFEIIGLPPDIAFFALIASLLGSYVNIPIRRIRGGPTEPGTFVDSFGVRYRVPAFFSDDTRSTLLTVNVGGAIVPVLLCIYVLWHRPSALVAALIGTALVAVVVHLVARPIRGLGIATPLFIPPLAAVVVAYLFAAVGDVSMVAYISGVIGTLVGADLANLGKLRDLGAPVVSIGGAGTFDGIFLTGIVAALLS